MILDAGCEMTIETEEPAPALLMLLPQSGDGQTVAYSQITIDPFTAYSDFTDVFGNHCRRIILQPGTSTIRATCQVTAPDEITVDHAAPYTLAQDLPDDVLQYLLPSRYCQSDLLFKMAQKITAKSEPGYPQPEAIRTWIQKKVKYKYGTSDASTSAVDTAKKRVGVCRDFSHLGIALCRALRIPARMVVGYLHELDPMDLHAWFEAYVGGRWYTFDATQKTPKGNRIVVAYGRDACDVAQLTEYAPIKTTAMSVWVQPAAN